MSFRSQKFVDEPLLAGEIRFDPRPVFLSSAAHRRLVEDLKSYCAGEIGGRSYLIAGHRGSGKTAISLRSVEDVTRWALQSSLRPPTSGERPPPLVRPLLVKLYGPALLKPLLASAPPPATDGDKPPETAPTRRPKRAAKAAAPEATPLTPGADDAPTDADFAAVSATLKQVTIGLYRALALQMCQGYAVKAKAHATLALNTEELAAQLRLDLDAGGDPANLRDYWNRIERLLHGVLWPRGADAVMNGANTSDQGLREILAVATAAEAFQACTGDFQESRDDTRTNSREAQSKGEGSTDLKEVIGRLGALGVAGLTGSALWGANHAAALGAGVLVWLLGSASVGWSFTNTRKRDQVVKYTFLRDRTVQALDRDLPVVIERVRQAGLAPVFIVDELDKVEDASRLILQIFGRLKHIIVDSGFFIFITDRPYFDEIEGRLSNSAFPVEHTLFSERRLLAYGPEEYEAFVRELIVPDPPFSPNDDLARWLLALYLTHKARLNFTDLSRYRRRVIDRGLLERTSSELLSQTDLLLGASVQLAIDIVLQDAQLSVRMADDPSFAQLTYDTLYDISRVWESDATEYDMSTDRLKKQLAKRARAEGAADAAFTPDPADLALWVRARKTLVALISDFPLLANRVGALPVSERARLVSLVPTLPGAAAGLLAAKDGQPGYLTFTYDIYGRSAEQAPPDGEEVKALTELIEGFGGLLEAQKIAFEDLVAAQLLPSNLDWGELQDARRDMAAWNTALAAGDLPPQSIHKARELRTALNDHGPRLGAGLVLARKLAVAGSASSATMRKALAAMARYPVFGPATAGGGWKLATWARTNRDFPGLALKAPVTGDPASLGPFQAAIARTGATAQDRKKLKVDLDDQWKTWAARFRAYFANPTAAPAKPAIADLAAATQGVGLSSLLRQNLATLSPAEWSAFSLARLRAAAAEASGSRWALIAGLRAQGFEARLLNQLTDTEWPNKKAFTDYDLTLARQMARGAPRGRKGVLVLLEGDLESDFNTPSGGPPLLFVRSTEVAGYKVGLDWLQGLGAFEGLTSERTAS